MDKEENNESPHSAVQTREKGAGHGALRAAGWPLTVFCLIHWEGGCWEEQDGILATACHHHYPHCTTPNHAYGGEWAISKSSISVVCVKKKKKNMLCLRVCVCV